MIKNQKFFFWRKQRPRTPENTDGLRERLLFVFWTGSNKMSQNRVSALRHLRRNSGCKVIVVDLTNINAWTLSQAQLHPGYKFLSLIHKSDYLRSYFMLHYGGGYSDLKKLKTNLSKYYSKLEESSYEFLGYPESHPGAVAGSEQMQKDFDKLAGNCCFIFKPESNFSKSWFYEVGKVLDDNYSQLETCWQIHSLGDESFEYEFPFVPEGYPLAWAQLQGEIFHRLQWQNQKSYGLLLPPFAKLFNGEYRWPTVTLSFLDGWVAEDSNFLDASQQSVNFQLFGWLGRSFSKIKTWTCNVSLWSRKIY